MVAVGVPEVGGGADGLVSVALGDGLVADAEGDAVLEADTVGVALDGGASCVGFGDVRLGVGLAGRVAVVCGTVSTVVPGAVLAACDARTDAVVGAPTDDGPAGGEVEPVSDAC